MFQFSGFNIMFADYDRKFHGSYKCYSVSMLPGNERQDIEKGGKIIMPPSALDSLTRLNVEYPMLFKLKNEKKNRTTHAGVLEFIADEGRVYLPYWMMHNLQLDEGDLIDVNSISLPVVTYSKFQAQSPDFLDITNPKAVLENALRNFACLTTGDLIAINYNSKIYQLCVLETKPGTAVSIIECDMNVDFEAPIGYKHPENQIPKPEAPIEPMEEDVEDDSQMFQGEGERLDGKKKKDSQMLKRVAVKKITARGIPDYSSPYGLLQFDRSIVPISDRRIDEEHVENDVDAFLGQGASLKKN